jgi:type I restriction enzyme S subunit
MAAISNKEALKDKIHEIHNYLRNNGAGYGMSALKVFNVLYGLKKIEEKGLISEVGLSDESKFSYLVSLANEGSDELLANTIIGPVLDSINTSKLKDFLLYEIPRNIKGSVFSYLVKQIDSITKIEESCNVLLSGKIYEYFIGRDETAISDLGAYFTDRHIVEYILEKLSPCITDDGTIPSMIDPFGGSGGFTTGYINFINANYPEVDWSSEINKISHFDINEDVIKSAGLEIFCLTGQIPNMDNLKYKNAFKDDFGNGLKYDIILTNPPYGGDKNEKSEKYNKREKVKKYINDELSSTTDEDLKIRRRLQLKLILQEEKVEKKESEKAKVALENCSNRIQKFAKKNGELTGNDKESCSLILMMDLLEFGGTAIGVLKEGVFFNKTYKDLRRCLVQNFNVREVISVPQDQFENTSTKTSIVIFDNTDEKTRHVKFSDLTVERISEDKFGEIKGNIVLLENKGDICRVRDTLVSVASLDEILDNAICSLNGKDYGKKELIVGEGYEKVKLGDICEFLQKSKRKASFGQKKGEYNFYTSSDKVQRCNVADYKEECLIIGSGGIANIKLDTNFSCSADNFIVKSKNNNYLYNFLRGNMNLLSDGFSGSVLKHISKEYLLNLQIPIPKSPQKIKEWVDKISAPYNEKLSKQAEIQGLEEFVRERIREIELKEDCEDVELSSVCEVQDGHKFKDTDLNSNKINVPLIRATYINNKTITSFIKEDKKFNKYIVNKGDIIFSQVGDVGAICKYEESRFGYNKMNAFRLRGINFNQHYLFYYLSSSSFKNKLFSNGSIVKFIKIPELRSIKISLPKNKKLIQDLEPTFSRIETLQNEVKGAENLYKSLIQELSEEALPTQTDRKSSVSLCDDEVKSETPKIIYEEQPETPKKSNSSKTGCCQILSRGPNKGKECGKNCKSSSEYCSTHEKS